MPSAAVLKDLRVLVSVSEDCRCLRPLVFTAYLLTRTLANFVGSFPLPLQ